MIVRKIKQKIKHHDNQKKFIKCQDNIILLISPTRAGKSEGMITKIIIDSYNIKGDTLVTAPVYRSLHTVLEEPIVQRLRDKNILKSYNKNLFAQLINGNTIHFRSALDPDISFRGLNIKKIFIDEATLISEYAFDILLGRMSYDDSQIVLTGTPKGKNNWVYKRFFAEGNNDKVTYIRYNIRDNPIISDKIIKRWKESFDIKLFEQEIDGKWVTLYQDQVYHAWAEECIDNKAVYNPNLQVYVGVDFNINKNPWAAMQKYPDRTIKVFKTGMGTKTTPDMGRQIIQQLGNDVYIIPDATGGAREKGSGHTQFQLLKQAGLKHISTNKSNPLRTERISIVNALLTNAIGQHLLRIHPSCKELIQELRDISYKKELVGDIDTQNGEVGHLTDALGYPCFHLTKGNVKKIRQVEYDTLGRIKQMKYPTFM